MVTSQGSQGSPTPGGDGEENGKPQQRRPAASRPIPTPADVFPPHRKRRPAPPASQEPGEREEGQRDGREGDESGDR
ncbi:hypothetical protein GCM10022245_69140 [Streptomyces mayteni]